jgi:hypothetical protein
VPRQRRALIYPYDRLVEEIPLSLSNLRLDGSAPDRDPIVADFRTADVSAVAPDGWNTLEVEANAPVPTDELEEFEAGGRQPLVVIVVDCPATNLRASVICQHHGSGQWTGSIVFERDRISGTVLVRAVLAATVNGGRRREVGESPVWTIHVDPPSIPVIEGNLPVRWINFETSEVIPESVRNDPFFADLSEDAPVVYLNSGFEGLPELLSDDTNRPVAELALREAEYRRIATSVWMGMFNVAAAAIEFEGNDEDAEPGLPQIEWQRSVLQALIPRMYDETESEVLARIVAARLGDESRDIQARVAAAIAQVVDHSGSLKRRIKQLDPAGDSA